MLKKLLFTLCLIAFCAKGLSYDFKYNGINYTVTSMPDRTVEVAFDYHNDYHGSIVIPEKVDYNDITFTVTSIAANAFSSLSGSSVTSVTMPGSIKNMGDNVFDQAKSLLTVKLSENLTSIPSETFRYCTSLQNVEIPAKVTSIGTSAFQGCSALAIMILPDILESIADMAFDGCSALKALEIPDRVKTIGQRAIRGCTDLESLIIGKNVLSIGEQGLANNTSLKKIVSKATTPPKCEQSALNNDNIFNCILYPPIGYSSTYKKSFPWNNFSMQEDGAYIKFKNADNGSLDFKVELGKEYAVRFQPSLGWQIETVSFNGVDVTAHINENQFTTPVITATSELNVVYRQEDSESNKKVDKHQNLFKVLAYSGKLKIENKGREITVTIHSASGKKIASKLLRNGINTIDLPTNQIYNIKIGHNTYKFAL